MDILYSFLPLLIFYGIGFYAGKHSHSDPISEIVKETKKHIERIESPKVGVIRRPTAEQLAKRTDPYEKKLKEGADAMSETLSKIKELQ